MDQGPPAPAAHVTLNDLQPELLIRIAELVNPSDLASLRLANRALLAAVEEAAVCVRPSIELQPAQLSRIHNLFNKATALNLCGCSALDSNALRDLQSLASLRVLLIDTG